MINLDLFCDRGDGVPLHPDSFSRAFKRLAKAGISPKARLHDARHAVATTLLTQGVHPAITSAALGHASPAFTMSTYQHVVDGMGDVAAVALEAALGGRSGLRGPFALGCLHGPVLAPVRRAGQKAKPPGHSGEGGI